MRTRANAASWWFVGVALLILMTAAALRLIGLHQYPPGPHYDEAAYLLITRSIAFDGARPFPIVEAYQGREVLYMYLSAPLLHLIANDVFTLRVTSVFCNLITIAATIALGRAMFGGRRGVWIGLAAGVLFAVSFPQVWLARQAFRAVTLPMCQALALLLIWRGLRARGWRSVALLIGGGGFAGAALYTYMASRLFPLWIVVALAALIAFDRRRWRQTAIVVIAMTIIAAPMIGYAIEKPTIFFGRLSEVTQAEGSVSLVESIGLHLRMFFIDGDPYLRYNDPHRPYFTPIEGAFLVIGLGVSAWRWSRRRREDEPSRAAALVTMLAPLMVIPSVISVGGLPPSHMRSLSMIPLIFILVALGAEAVWRLLVSRVRLVNLARAPAIALVVALIIGGITVGQAYFAWAARADLYYQTDADLSAAARWIATNSDTSRIIQLAARDKGHPTAMIEDLPPLVWIGTDSLFALPDDRSTIAVFPRSAPPPADWRAWLEPYRVGDLPLAPDGREAFEAFDIPGGAALPTYDPPPAPAHSAIMTLVGWQAPAIEAGSSGEGVALWRIDAATPSDDFTPLLEVLDANGERIARAEAYVAGASAWPIGATLMQRLTIAIPYGTPPGDYMVRGAWVARAADRYAPYLTASGAQAGIWAALGTLTIERSAVPPDESAIPFGVSHLMGIAPGVTLLGWDELPANAQPGEAVPLTLYWRADGPATRAAFTIEAILTPTDGRAPIMLGRQTPIGGRYPVEAWSAGEMLADRTRWLLPRDLPNGDYQFSLLINGAAVLISTLTIDAPPRVFEMPSFNQAVNARFGDGIALMGWTIERGADGGLQIAMVWRADSLITRDYTVFVHALDGRDEIAAQRDQQPVDNRYPTSHWLMGEYIVDSYAFNPEEIATVEALRIGLYDRDTRLRLAIALSEADHNLAVEADSVYVELLSLR